MKNITSKIERQKRKATILHVVSRFPPSTGGMQNLVYGAVRQLQKHNYNVKVITTRAKNSERYLKTKGVERYYALKFGNIILSPTAFFAGMRDKYDIVHLHLGLGMLPEFQYIACKLKKVPYVVHIHIAPYKSTRAGVFLPLYMPIFKKIVRDAYAVLVYTKDYANLMSTMCHVSKNKIMIAPPGIDDIFFEHNVKNIKRKDDLLWVGRLCKQKNLPLLITAYKLIVKKIPEIKLHIVGDGPDRYNLEQMVMAHELTGRVIIHGKLSQTETRELMKKNSLLIMTSEIESFGLVLVEAMSQGMPVVATNILSVRQVITKKTGILSPSEPKKFAKIVVSLLNNKNMIKKMRTAAIAEAQKYRWKTVVKNYEKLYFEVTRDKK